MILKKIPEVIFATSKASDGNMSFLRGDPSKVLGNRKKFLKKIKINLDSTIGLTQIHGAKIIKVGRNELGRGAYSKDDAFLGDGLITNEPGIYLMIKGADCHQIGIFDSKQPAIALIHAGWRGLKKGIIKKTILKMAENFGSKPKDLIVEFGPAIGPCCYKTDIWKEAENQLKENGVLPKNIDNPKICTYHNNEYFSHRRAEDKKQEDLRFVTILGIKNVN